jgi:Secretion system C-terminal sorting domain
MKQIFRTASFLFIVTVFISPKVFAQRIALFETFTGPASTCVPQQETAFESAVKSTATSDASKIVHLNYYLGIGGPGGLDINGGIVDGRLSGTSGNGSVLYTGAVNREVFSNTGARIDPTTAGSYSDWGAQVDADGGTPEATITLNYATIDKTDSGGAEGVLNLHADMTVTANQSISDSLVIRFAITQDGVKVFECGASKGDSVTFNDMAWYVSTANTSKYIVCTPSSPLSSSNTVHVTWDYSIDVSDPLYQNPSKMKFVAFLEDQGSVGSGNYFVANAAILKQDLDTLQPPPPTLTLTESSISGDTLHPGPLPVDIFYSSTNLPSGVNAFYSLNNGTTWSLIGNNLSNPVSWIVPDSVTTEGKIKLVAVGDTTLKSTEIGTFTIANPPSVTFIEPQPAQIIKGGTKDTIYWTKVSVDNALLRYSLDNGATFTKLQDNADTFYVWSVPDTNRGVVIQLVPDNSEAPAAAVIDTIESAVVIPPLGVAANSVSPSGLTIMNIFPNPASNGEDMVVQYFEAQPKPLTVQLLDLLGRIIPESYSTDNLAIHLNTGTLAAGAYVVRVSDGTSTVSKRVEIIR